MRFAVLVEAVITGAKPLPLSLAKLFKALEDASDDVPGSWFSLLPNNAEGNDYYIYEPREDDAATVKRIARGRQIWVEPQSKYNDPSDPIIFFFGSVGDVRRLLDRAFDKLSN